MPKVERPRCEACGRFVGLRDMETGKAVSSFTPDSEYGPERIEWLCGKCHLRELGDSPTNCD